MARSIGSPPVKRLRFHRKCNPVTSLQGLVLAPLSLSEGRKVLERANASPLLSLPRLALPCPAPLSCFCLLQLSAQSKYHCTTHSYSHSTAPVCGQASQQEQPYRLLVLRTVVAFPSSCPCQQSSTISSRTSQKRSTPGPTQCTSDQAFGIVSSCAVGFFSSPRIISTGASLPSPPLHFCPLPKPKLEPPILASRTHSAVHSQSVCTAHAIPLKLRLPNTAA